MSDLVTSHPHAFIQVQHPAGDLVCHQALHTVRQLAQVALGPHFLPVVEFRSEELCLDDGHESEHKHGQAQARCGPLAQVPGGEQPLHASALSVSGHRRGGLERVLDLRTRFRPSCLAAYMALSARSSQLGMSSFSLRCAIPKLALTRRP